MLGWGPRYTDNTRRPSAVAKASHSPEPGRKLGGGGGCEGHRKSVCQLEMVRVFHTKAVFTFSDENVNREGREGPDQNHIPFPKVAGHFPWCSFLLVPAAYSLIWGGLLPLFACLFVFKAVN